MSALLDDIINAVTYGQQSLPDILRKCLLLGHELKNERLKEWANQELNGFGSREELPEYRVLPATSKGNFLGPLRAQYSGHIIPPAVLDKEHQEFVQKVYLTQSVSALTEVARRAGSGKGEVTFPWPPNMVGYYQDKILDGGWICHAAWQEVSYGALTEVLDKVRNITLNMALKIKDELGTSYTDLRKIESSEKQASIQNIIFQNTGGNTNVALGEANLNASGQVQVVISQGDRRGLDEILSKAGLDPGALQKLTLAIQEDGGKKPGSKVGVWIKENAGKVLSGGVKVGVSIGQQLLTEWLKQHYGIH